MCKVLVFNYFGYYISIRRPAAGTAAGDLQLARGMSCKGLTHSPQQGMRHQGPAFDLPSIQDAVDREAQVCY